MVNLGSRERDCVRGTHDAYYERTIGERHLVHLSGPAEILARHGSRQPIGDNRQSLPVSEGFWRRSSRQAVLNWG